MSYAEAVYDVLNADPTLVAILTGGVYLYRDLGPEGINREDTPDAFNSAGLMLPLVIVKGRGNIPTSFLRDEGAQYASTRQVIECWLYDDREAGWDTLKSAAQQIYALLHDRQVAGSFGMQWVNQVDEFREESMSWACSTREDYAVIGRRTGS